MILPSLLVLSAGSARAQSAFFPGAKRVVFLGDSITYSGQYIEYLLTRTGR